MPEPDALSEDVTGVRDAAPAKKSEISLLINPPHPTKPNVSLHLGKNSQGTFVYFEPIEEGERSDSWRFFRDCRGHELVEARELDGAGKLACRQGPVGHHLVVYEP